MLKKVSTFPYSLLHCRIVHSEPWASPHESKVRIHLMIQRRELVSFLTGLLHSSRIKLSCEAEFQMAWWYWLPKTTCLLSPAGTEVIAQLLAEPHSPYNSHLSQFPHWEIHICCPRAIDLLGRSLSHFTSTCGSQCWDFSPQSPLFAMSALSIYFLSSVTSSRLCQRTKGRMGPQTERHSLL